MRVRLGHTPPSWVSDGSAFFITISCADRGVNQLCKEPAANFALDAAQHYGVQGKWFLRLFLLMPDHLHAIISPAPSLPLARLVGDWKRFVARAAGIQWQKNFFDHRLRAAKELEEKAAYIRANPVRAGLISQGEPWPFVVEN
jgi:putative transposase